MMGRGIGIVGRRRRQVADGYCKEIDRVVVVDDDAVVDVDDGKKMEIIDE